MHKVFSLEKNQLFRQHEHFARKRERPKKTEAFCHFERGKETKTK